MKQRGYFGIGIENGKTADNVGMLWRSAHNLGASFIFTVGDRYRRDPADTTKASGSVPLYRYATFDDLAANLPAGCSLVGVEFPHVKARELTGFCHPERAVYVLGAEDCGLSPEAQERCNQIVYIPSEHCLNVAVAGSIVMYDRNFKFATSGGYARSRAA